MSQQDGFAGGFLMGTLVGGLVGGALGVILASRMQGEGGILEREPTPEANRPTKEKQTYLGAGEAASWEAQISQLNDAIDELRSQVGLGNGMARIQKEQSQPLSNES